MNPDPRCNFFSQKKQRLNNRSLRSDYVDNSLLNFIGGPLNMVPKNSQVTLISNSNAYQSIKNSSIKSGSPLQKYGNLLLSQRQSQLAKAMLQRSNGNGQKTKKINLDLSDRDRYYFKRTGSVDHSQLLARNSMASYLKQNPISHDKIYGRHTVNPENYKTPYLGYSNFTPKMLNNADEVKNIIFGV